jgi:hypothetical protein
MSNNKPDMFADPDAWEADLVRRLTGTMAADANRQQAYSEGKIDSLVADTESEIFDETMGIQNRDEAPVDIDELSQVEGWDGPVSDQELMASAIQGETGDYIGDRPLQHQHELDVDQENRALRDQLAQAEQQRQALINQYDPYVRDQRQAKQQEFMYEHGLVSVDDSKANALFGYMNQLEQNRDQANRDRINSSMARAHEEYGRDFDATYTSLQQMDPNNPLTGQIMRTVLDSPDPGQSLMSLHQNDVVASLGTGRYTNPPPFARTREAQRGPLRVDRVARDEGEFDSGYGHQQVEEDVFNSALKDRPKRGYVNRGRGWEQE